MEINDLLHAAVDSGASDILLAAGAPPMFRIAGDLQPANLEPLSPPALESLCRQVLSDEQRERLETLRDVDFSVPVPRLGRFRFNIHWQKNSYAAAIRFISDGVPTLDELGLPPVLEQFTRFKHGLVLVTGQTGSGKTTTLAAMIDRINRRDAKHIITLEDPIEYQFTHARSLIEQREVGRDCPSFASGLRHVLRQDPDVILVGELRDLDTIRTALQAAETGHLVLATLHSSSAGGTIDRLIEVFPAEEQGQIRAHLAECLRAVVTQRLLPRADHRGRVAALEILVSTRAIQTSIREASPHLIPGLISTGRRFGMQTMEQALKELFLNQLIDQAAAEEHLTEMGAS
ncbi:MAG: type IV pilus twitching motility protein PilT [Planctomycetaceae bacterium]